MSSILLLQYRPQLLTCAFATEAGEMSLLSEAGELSLLSKSTSMAICSAGGCSTRLRFAFGCTSCHSRQNLRLQQICVLGRQHTRGGLGSQDLVLTSRAKPAKSSRVAAEATASCWILISREERGSKGCRSGTAEEAFAVGTAALTGDCSKEAFCMIAPVLCFRPTELKGELDYVGAILQLQKPD